MSLAPDPVASERQPGRSPRLVAWVDGVSRLARRRPRLTVAVVVVVVVALVGAGVRAWVTRDPGGPGWARSPRSAVQGYLDAVADGRAADALAYLSRPPADRTFLTDAVLARSRELDPMTEVVVGAVSDDGYDKKCRYGCTVQAEYRLGDRKTKVALSVAHDDGYWFVETQPPTVRLTGYGSSDDISDYRLPVLVNGTALAPGTEDVVLFPGRYHATSGHPLVDVDTMFTVETPEERWDEPAVQLSPALTADGRQRVAQAAQDQIDTCLAQTSFDTGCGFLSYDSTGFDGPADPATITWALTGDTTMPEPGDQLFWSVFLTQQGLAVTVPVEIQARCTWTTVAGQAMEWEPYLGPNYYVADLTDPDSITVTFVHNS